VSGMEMPAMVSIDWVAMISSPRLGYLISQSGASWAIRPWLFEPSFAQNATWSPCNRGGRRDTMAM
jgi:hypothetical protein